MQRFCGLWKMWKLSKTGLNPHKIRQISTKNIHIQSGKVFHGRNVDNVDKLVDKSVFPDIYNISGAHSYQQIPVDTIF